MERKRASTTHHVEKKVKKIKHQTGLVVIGFDIIF
jgi:hypothetical protein